jgi:uncharacterized membrane protein
MVRTKADLWKSRIIVVLPIVFLFIAVFLTRSDVKWFFLASGLFILNTILMTYKKEKDAQRLFAYVLIVLASIGLAAATILTIEKIELLKDPARVTSCSISPIVGCSPVISRPQASAFDGIPNPVFGIFGFASLFAAGMTILAGARKLSRAWWLALFGGVIFGVGFCMWLFHEGVYDIGALCLYCMSVWLVTFSLFWFVLAELIRQKHLSINARLDKLVIEYRNLLIAATIGVVILLIYFRWSDYWNSLI